jgi:hypothetical protein
MPATRISTEIGTSPVDFVDAFNENRWMHFRHIQQGGYILNLSNCTKGNETSESENF